ncbi:MAG: TetR/AcrR family transcriptional regulator, partial [Pseudomonadota bacterium]
MPRTNIDDQRRAQILSALEACIVEQGLAKTSLIDVAARAGLARPLVRHFVGNRDSMIELLFETLIDRGEAQLEQIATTDTPPPLNHLLDLLFGDLFSNTASNVVVSELWSLA